MIDQRNYTWTLLLKTLAWLHIYWNSLDESLNTQKVYIEGKYTEPSYEVKGNNTVMLWYNTNQDVLDIFMTPSFSVSFNELSIVDPQNDTFLILSGFKIFRCEGLNPTSKNLETWRKYLAQFGTDVIVFLK